MSIARWNLKEVGGKAPVLGTRTTYTSEFGDEGAERIIILLDAYKTNHPGKCSENRDDYKVITSWVIQRFREERASPPTAGQDHTFMGKLEAIVREEEL